MNLKEAEYNKIFKPETIKNLDLKSKDSLKQLLGNKSLMQSMMRSQQLINQITEVESDYTDELEMLAVQIVKDMYPIIDYAGIEIDAQIVSMGDINLPNDEDEQDADSYESIDNMPESMKRRIINGISQGASIRGPYLILLFREYLDQINPSLLDKYNEILNLAFGIYDNKEAVAIMLGMLARGEKMEGGSSEAEFNEEENTLLIKARAINFPFLVHEIIKGLYEIISLQGFSGNKERNQQVVKTVDKLKNEPNDITYGKFIYDSLNQLYQESNIDDARVRELFLAELYKLPDNEFIEFIEDSINNKLSSADKKWALNTMKDIEKDLRSDDAGVEID